MSRETDIEARCNRAMNEQNCLRFGLVVIALILILMLSFFLNTRLAPGISGSIGIKTYKIMGSSMQPTLFIGDHIFIDLDSYTNAEPRREDLVVFKHPGDMSKDFIKRIVAIPGDTLEIKDKRLYINGLPASEPYVQYIGDTGGELPEKFGPSVVPKEKYFMLGDNRDQSIDSRHLGYIDRKLILGKARFVYWSKSLDRIGSELK
jgi:signal peptidase I